MKRNPARTLALETGNKYYESICYKHGLTLRNTKNRVCADCSQESNAQWRLSRKHGCPHCGDQHLVRFTTLNLKWCSGCRSWLPWHLEPGQKPLFS